MPVNPRKLALIVGLVVGVAAPWRGNTIPHAKYDFEKDRVRAFQAYVAEHEKTDGLAAYDAADYRSKISALPNFIPVGFVAIAYGFGAALLVLAAFPFVRWIRR